TRRACRRGARSNPHPHRRRQEPRQGPRKAYGAAPCPHTGATEGGRQTACARRYASRIGEELQCQQGYDFQIVSSVKLKVAVVTLGKGRTDNSAKNSNLVSMGLGRWLPPPRSPRPRSPPFRHCFGPSKIFATLRVCREVDVAEIEVCNSRQ